MSATETLARAMAPDFDRLPRDCQHFMDQQARFEAAGITMSHGTQWDYLEGARQLLGLPRR